MNFGIQVLSDVCSWSNLTYEEEFSSMLDYRTIIAPPFLTDFDIKMASLLGEND